MHKPLHEFRLLTPQEMQAADRLTIQRGTSGFVLMRMAGRRVAEAAVAAYPQARRFDCLAGPGNNGGDAFEAARHLRALDRVADVYLLGSVENLSGDAARAAAAFGAEPRSLLAFDPAGADVVIDGLFGAGLSRAPEGDAAEAIGRLAESGRPVVAIDLPSGVSGLTGEAMGVVAPADLTVTFFRAKPGHQLEPGRSLCGRLLVVDIGILEDVLDGAGTQTFRNAPALWPQAFAAPRTANHKYDRGHAVAFSGGTSQTGAARMAARAALRAGAGLVTVFSPRSALLVNAAHLTAIMLKPCDDSGDLAGLLADRRFNAFLIGPGFGTGAKAIDFIRALIEADRALVIDADAITAFREQPDDLFAMLHRANVPAVLTPHEGEFARLFPDLAHVPCGKLERARRAAARAGAVVLLKGSDTVIAAPDGRAAINDTGTPFLATAGSGDVLAGIILGFLAQGVPAFEAACASAWMHGEAARHFGPGLIAEDLPDALLPVLRNLLTA